MKTLITLHPKKLAVGLVLLSFLVSCTQEPLTEENHPTLISELNANSFKEIVLNTQTHPVLNDSQFGLLEKISKEIILLAQQPKFREQIFSESVQQQSGDFDFELSNLNVNSKSNSKNSFVFEEISSLSKKFEQETGGIKLKLYYPHAARFDKENGANFRASNKTKVDNPEIVLMNNYNEDYSSPAFQINDKGELVFSKNVTEDYAANNNVYIIGSESISTNKDELLMPEDPYLGGGGGEGGGGTPVLTYRTEGRAEYGGKIQITDINEIEHWTAGRLEMRIVVVNSSGAVIKDKQFPKRDRSNFKDKRWYDFNEFLFNWNTQYIGSWNVETWFEVDGGSDKTFTITSPPPSGTSGPTISATVNVKAQDNNLGKSIVQFPDKIQQVYGISFMNFQRK